MSALLDKVVAAIADDEVAELALGLSAIPGPTGHEGPVADFVHQWLSHRGFHAFRQEVLPDRPNVIGMFPGTDGGRTLLFNSHMDTAEGAPEDRYGPQYEPGSREGDRLYGRSVFNDRGPMAAFLIAAWALQRAGVRLKGDLLLTAVVGEIGMAPVEEFQGPRFEAKGVGSRYLVTHGVIADAALVAETTDWGVTWVECGAAYFKIALRGEAIYTPRLNWSGPLHQHPNAIVRMAKVVQLLEEWAGWYTERNTRHLPVGTIVPRVNIGAIRGGLPHRPNRSASYCSIYLDVRVPPEEDALPVLRELEETLRVAGFPAQVEMYLWRKGHVGRNVESLVQCIEHAYRACRGESLPPVPSHVTSMWRDINVFNEVGIPAVTFGPPRRTDERGHRYLAVSDLADAARMYALIAAEFCGIADA